MIRASLLTVLLDLCSACGPAPHDSGSRTTEERMCDKAVECNLIYDASPVCVQCARELLEFFDSKNYDWHPSLSFLPVVGCAEYKDFATRWLVVQCVQEREPENLVTP